MAIRMFSRSDCGLAITDCTDSDRRNVTAASLGILFSIVETPDSLEDSYQLMQMLVNDATVSQPATGGK